MKRIRRISVAAILAGAIGAPAGVPAPIPREVLPMSPETSGRASRPRPPGHRWRLGLAEGESKYDDLETRLAKGPVITVPTITLEGDANGAPHPDPGSYASKFSGKHEHRTINGGVGHNLPQEAPEAFARAVVGVDGY
jgi:hypothetical protein